MVKKRVVCACVVLAVIAGITLGQHDDHPQPPEHAAGSPMRKALELLREGRSADARTELNRLLAQDEGNAELHWQLARSYLVDFYGNPDPAKGRTALSLAMEALSNVLRRDSNHIPALKAKAVIHARAELLYYDPNLAYQLGARVAELQPSASEYLLTLTDWMSGEVRFTSEGGHRVPHDPLTGLDRSIEILHKVLDASMPWGNEEMVGLYQMGKTLAKRRNYTESIRYFEMALRRNVPAEQRGEILREMGASYYRMGNFGEAARAFYRAMQARIDPIDGWLLHVSLEQWGEKGVAMPPEFEFPMAEAPNVRTSIALEDIAKQLGVNRFDGNGTCAFGDIDEDGNVDLLLAGSGTFLGVYRNERGRFIDITAAAGLAGAPSGYSLNLVDFDNDGKLDLYLALNGWNGPMRNLLYRNAGNGKFVDVSKDSGADDPGSGFVSVWGDLDNDGLPDLVIANGVLKDGSVPQIYRNNGDGTFENVTKQAGIVEPPTHGTIGVALGDYDRDGDLDIFFNGLNNSPNRLYRNDGKMRFTEVSRKAGVQQPAHTGYVAFFTDYNNDAWPDLLVTSLAPWDAVVQSLTKYFAVPNVKALHPDAVRLYRNNGDGTFRDVTIEAGLIYPMGVMGAGVADLDNDGFVDFYFGTGDPQLSRIEPNRLFQNTGKGSFVDVTRIAGLAQPGKKGHGVCFVDIDNDGDLELYAQLGGHYPGDHAENAFYRNRKGNENNWLQLELEGTKSNRYGIGANVVVTAGDLRVYGEMKGSEGFGSTSPYRLHFGLGRQARVDAIEVIWPSGLKQRFEGIAANTRWLAREGDDKLAQRPPGGRKL